MALCLKAEGLNPPSETVGPKEQLWVIKGQKVWTRTMRTLALQMRLWALKMVGEMLHVALRALRRRGPYWCR